MQTRALGLSSFARLFQAKDRANQTDSPRPELESLPFVAPIVRRGLPDQVAARLIRDRLVRLLGKVAEAQKEIRTERAVQLSGRLDRFKSRIENMEIKDVSSADALFQTVGAMSKDLEAILDDADYLSFRTIGTITQLRAANIALRSSRFLWQSIRVGDALRDPELMPRALHLLQSTESIALAARDGEDVRVDLSALEKEFSALARDVEERAGDSGLKSGASGIRVSRRVWDYRMAIEGAAGKRMSNGELAAWLKKNGLPAEVMKQLLEEDVAKQLLRFANDEGVARGDAGDRLSAKAIALAQKVSATPVEALGDVDKLEPIVREIGAELDQLLNEAERILRPFDKPIRKLRAANDALTAMRGLFTAMRLMRAIEDPAFRDQAEDLAGKVRALGEPGRNDRYETRLAAIAEGLDVFEREVARRLKIDTVPYANESKKTVETARRVVRCREALTAASRPEVIAAFHALGDLQMRPEERHAIYQKAQGRPLLEALVNVIVASRQLELGVSFADAGRGINDLMRIGGRGGELNPYLAKSPFAFLGKADFERAFRDFDAFLASADTPQGRKWIDNGLNVFRAAVRVEQENVDRVALFIPPEQRAYVATSIAEWTAKSSLATLQFLGDELSEPGGEAFADVLDSIISTTENHLDGMLARDAKELSNQDAVALRDSVKKQARTQAFDSSQEQLLGAMTKIGDRRLDNTPLRIMPALNAELVKALSCVETTDDSRDAMRSIVKDLGASARMLVHMVHLFGAASNDKMDETKRAQAIRSSVERMGPLFIKMMQTLVNMQSILQRVKPDHDSAKSDPLFAALRTLQDDCTPLPWSVVKQELESSLGQPIDKAFLWIDEKPLKAGSIGQTHRAKIDVDGKAVDVVVKVLRPGIDENFADTIRVTQLTLSIFREMLRLDADGAIFGEIKANAEEKLPMLERALESFIESFRIETNFKQEADNMRRFGRMLGPERHIAVPLVYDSHSKGNVLTMQEMRGVKLSQWLGRYEWARERPALVEDRGHFSGALEAKRRAVDYLREACGVRAGEAVAVKHNHGWWLVRADRHQLWVRETNGQVQAKTALPALEKRSTEARVSRWAERTFGLPVQSISAEPHLEKKLFRRAQEGMLVTVRFDGASKQPPAQVFVRAKDARIIPKSMIPDLSEHGIIELRDRLGSTFVNQVLAGLLHGDPHEGNFFIMPDGKTIALLDFGLAIDLELHDASGPLKLMAGAWMQNPKKMAEAIASMAMSDPNASHRDQLRVIVKLTKHCRAVIDEVKAEKKANTFQRTCALMERSMDVMLNRAGIPPRAHVLQSLKSAFSMGGNIAAIEEHVGSAPYGSTARKSAADLAKYQVVAPLFGEAMHKKKAARIETMTLLDARLLAVSNAAAQ